MTIEEKLKLFYQTTVDDATEQSVAMVEEYEKVISEQYDGIKASLKEKSDQMFRMESDEMLHEKNKAISQVSRDIRKQILEEEKSYKDIAFSMVEKKLIDYMKTEEYKKQLIQMVEEALTYAKNKEYTIYINPSDEKWKDEIEKATKATLSISRIDFIGGIRAIIREQNLLIDNSFLAKLTEEKETYSIRK